MALTSVGIRNMHSGKMFRSGYTLINGVLSRFVAVRGIAADWAIYTTSDSKMECDPAAIARSGNKVPSFDTPKIRECVPCDDAALAMYRR